MADKHISENSLQANSSILGEKIVSLASKQLDALCEETKKAKVARILDRKRKKWREKHKLETPPAQGNQTEAKRSLEETASQISQKLVKQRDAGLEFAERVQGEESRLTIEAFRARLDREKRQVEKYISQHKVGHHSPSPPPTNHEHNSDYLGIIKDLEATIYQAEAVAEIRRMKTTPLSRVPQLHNRTLSGNILEQSLNVLPAGSILEESDNSDLQIIGEEVSISNQEHPDLQIIGEEVSVPQEEETKAAGAGGGKGEGGGGGGERGEAKEGCCESPEKLPCSDDTPGIGMEVVCVGGMDGMDSSAQHLSELDTAATTIISSQNGYVNGLEDLSNMSVALLAVQQQQQQQQLSPGGAKVRPGPSEALEDGMMEPSDTSLHRKILQLVAGARYDLRFPVQRYSSHASRENSVSQAETSLSKVNGIPEAVSTVVAGKKRNRASMYSMTPLTNSGGGMATPPSKRRGRPPKVQPSLEVAGPLKKAPLALGRKRGRPRKHFPSPAAAPAPAVENKVDNKEPSSVKL